MNINTMNDAPRSEQPWWFVRASLLVTFVLLTMVLVALLAPTPLNEWVFGESFALTLAGR